VKAGFTLIELMIVIIIIGVLATIGIVQYKATVEKSRGAEAKGVMGYLRGQCAAKYMETGDTSDCTTTVLNLGSTLGTSIPTSSCLATNYFKYSVTAGTPDRMVFTATRCTTGGKTPQGKTAATVNLTTNYTAGTDTWSSSGNY